MPCFYMGKYAQIYRNDHTILEGVKYIYDQTFMLSVKKLVLFISDKISSPCVVSSRNEYQLNWSDSMYDVIYETNVCCIVYFNGTV